MDMARLRRWTHRQMSLVLVLGALMACGLLPWATADAQQQPPPNRAASAADGDIEDWYIASSIPVTHFIEKVAVDTGHIFIYNPAELRGKEVYLLAQGTRMPKAARYNFMLAVLKNIGYTVTYFGENTETNVRIYEIKQLEAAGRQMGDLGRNIDDLRETANFVTMVVHLEYADPASVQRALLNLVTRPGGVIQPITGVNAVLISDFEFQIKRMAELLRLLDRPGPQMEMVVLPVQFADATQIATTVGNLVRARLQAQRQAQPGAQAAVDQILIEADQRTNALIVQALPENIRLIRQLVNRLDIEIPNEIKGRIHIYFCRHADATSLQSTLDSLISSDAFARNQQGQPGQPAQPGQPQPTPTPTPVRPQSQFRGPSNPGEEYRPRIVADENTNSLIITATAEDYLEIRRIISELDIRKPQVMIEAAIIEVNATDNTQFGIELAQLNNPKEGELRFFGGSAFGFSQIVDSDGIPIGDVGQPAGNAPRTPGSALPNGILLGLTNGPFSIPVLLRALQETSATNVLSQPRVLTNDNQQATLTFTEQEPTRQQIQGRTTDSTGFGGYEDAGITFTITPHISSESGREYLRLEIDIKVEKFTGAPPGPDLPRRKFSRQITGEVTIPDNATIVIGGLTETTVSKTVSKVPILGDIPILGELFRTETNTQERKNLYIFLRPVILRDDDFGDLIDYSQKTISESESDVGDRRTERYDAFFRRARDIEETFGREDEGRPRRRHRYLGTNVDYGKLEDDYTRYLERRALMEESDTTPSPASPDNHSNIRVRMR